MISFFHILFFSILLIQPDPQIPTSLFHGSRQEKNIALTFDACPSTTHGGFDSQIAQTLSDSNVSATLFLSGKWITKHKEAVKRLALQPNIELANHSYSHPHCRAIPDDSIMKELLQTEQLLKSYSGTSLKLFRPPFAETDSRIERVAHELGFRIIMYDVASGDPDSTISKERLVQYVTSRVRNGSIIIMHINGRGWHTAEALPEIIKLLRKKGFTFGKVSELIEAQKTLTIPAINNK